MTHHRFARIAPPLRPAAMALPFAILLSACGRNTEEPLTLTGIVEANTVRVSAQTPGIITALSFEEGAPVTANQQLAKVETERLGYQVDQTRYAMQEIEHQHAAAKAQVQAAAILRNNIRQKHERFVALLTDRAATQQMVDDLKAQLDAANEQLKSAATALKTLEAKRLQVDANRKALGTQVKDATIVSPLDGTVLVRYVEKGELVGTGTPVCEIANLQEVWTKIFLPEQDLVSAALGKPVTITVDGLPGKQFPGTISWISSRAEFTPKTILTEETRTTLVYAAKVTMQNPDGVFKIGMPITVTVPRLRP